MIFLVLSCLMVYLEIVYHIFGFGMTAVNPILTLGLCLCTAGIESFFLSLFQKKAENILFWIMSGLHVMLYGVQLIYLRIFKQPLLLAAAVHGGTDALTNYWKEALYAVLEAWLPVILMIFPLIIIGISRKKWEPISRKWRWRQRKQYTIGFVLGILVFTAGIFAGKWSGSSSIKLYEDFSNPIAVFEEYGVLAGIQRNVGSMIFDKQTEDIFLEVTNENEKKQETVGEDEQEKQPESEDKTENGKGQKEDSGNKEPENSGPDNKELQNEEPELDCTPNILPIDFKALAEKEERDGVKSLHQYVESRTPTKKNVYTGMFKDYNLIYLTAEGFAPYCVDETVTPTLYKLLNSGFQFKNYYVPLWHTSTSDGEFANCTGLLPDKQFSFRRSADNQMPFLLPAFFKSEGVQSMGYHNGSLSYYDRYLTHENMGYFFKAGNTGKLPDAQWQEHIFPMEHPNAWPQSDLEMMQGTLGDYINQPRFHAYYMTISGHLQYNFSGNAMAAKNKDAVQNLPYSEKAKAYIACNVELDRALEWLIEELEKAGKLENTVICLGADHYPYGLEEPEIEELRGAPLEKKEDLYRSGLILWNSAMDSVVVEKPCSSVDILPTLLNLFGFSYDSRLYSGQDILSDSSPLVVFSDNSFLTEQVYYDARSGKAESRNGAEVNIDYVENKKKQVKNLFTFSAGILDYNYYGTLEEYVPKAQ